MKILQDDVLNAAEQKRLHVMLLRVVMSNQKATFILSKGSKTAELPKSGTNRDFIYLLIVPLLCFLFIVRLFRQCKFVYKMLQIQYKKLTQ